MMASYQTCVKVFAILAITICLSAQLVSSGYVKWVSTNVSIIIFSYFYFFSTSVSSK